MQRYLVALFIVLFTGNLCAQQNVAADAPNLFIQCERNCDIEHLKTQLNYLNFVRDRQDADVFIQITQIRMANGNREYTLDTKGQARFENMGFMSTYVVEENTPQQESRNAFVSSVEQAVIPFILQTTIKENFTYSIKADENSGTTTSVEEKKDPWNLWVFRVSANGFFNGEESYNSLSLSGRVNASKTTEKSNTSFSSWVSNRESKFKFDDDVIVATNNSSGARIKQTKAISPNWSVGAVANAFQSTFSNYDLSIGIKPAIEYNIFPYKDATKRQLTFLYYVGPNFNNYTDTTLFNQTKETLYNQSLDMDYRNIKDWGSFSVGLTGSNYLHDFDKNRLSINPNVELNVIKGLRIDLGGYFQLSRDQLSLPKGGSTPEEILLRQRQLASNYSYFGNFGISYRFGSSNANVVNTRMRGL